LGQRLDPGLRRVIRRQQAPGVGNKKRLRVAVEKERLAHLPRAKSRPIDQHPVVRPDQVQGIALGRPPTNQPRRRRCAACGLGGGRQSDGG
jgi:hypothetical protein